MAKFHKVNFRSDRQPHLHEFFDLFEEAHKDDLNDWYFIRSYNSTMPVQFAIPQHTEVNEFGVPESCKTAIVIGPIRFGAEAYYAVNPCSEDFLFDGVLIFHDGLFFSEYDTETKRLLTSQSIPDVEHVSKTPRGIKESIQTWIPWSYLASSFIATVVD